MGLSNQSGVIIQELTKLSHCEERSNLAYGYSDLDCRTPRILESGGNRGYLTFNKLIFQYLP